MVILLQDFLVNNVLQTVVELVSDPDFLNEVFIILLSDEPLDFKQSKSSEDQRSNDSADKIASDFNGTHTDCVNTDVSNLSSNTENAPVSISEEKNKEIEKSGEIVVALPISAN